MIVEDPNVHNAVEIRHTALSKLSYGVGNIIPDFMGAVLGVVLLFFYETEVGLSTWLTGLALIIFAVWDGINDPIVGYLSDLPNRFTGRWGRRFPWIVASFVPMVFVFVLIFYPPAGAPEWAVFTWLIVMTCLFDTLESFFVVNLYGLFPEKFRIEGERTSVATIITYFVIAGTIFGTVLPPLLIVTGELHTYALVGWATIAICAVAYVLCLHGMRDDKSAVKRYLANYRSDDRKPLISASVGALRQKNLLLYICFILGYFTLISSLSSSLLYFTKYVLVTNPDLVTRFLATLFGGALVGAPLWLLYVRKTRNNKSVLVIGGLIVAVGAIAFSFVDSLAMYYAVLLVQGLGVGGLLVMMTPVFSDVIDESVIQTGVRNEGLFSGFRFLAINFGRVVSIIILAAVHEISGFLEQGTIEAQPVAAIAGIRFHTGLIPGLFMLAGVLVFWAFYDLTPSRTAEIKKDLIREKL